MIEFLRVGIIANSHGLKGEVKVIPTTEDVQRFYDLEKVYIEKNNAKTEVHIESVKMLNKFIVLKFKEFNNIDDILRFKSADLMINREDAIELEDGEYFVGDLIGCEIYDDEKVYGKIKDVIFTGANDVYVVDYDGKDLLIPVTYECVLDIDICNKKIKVNMIKGLLD